VTASVRRPGGDVSIFKSVGTALQDLALAARDYHDEALVGRGDHVARG